MKTILLFLAPATRKPSHPEHNRSIATRNLLNFISTGHFSTALLVNRLSWFDEGDKGPFTQNQDGCSDKKRFLPKEGTALFGRSDRPTHCPLHSRQHTAHCTLISSNYTLHTTRNSSKYTQHWIAHSTLLQCPPKAPNNRGRPGL